MTDLPATEQPTPRAPFRPLTNATLPVIELGKGPRSDLDTMLLRAAFRENVKSREDFDALITRMKARFTALNKALAGDSQATELFARRFDEDYVGEVAPGREHEEALQDVQSVFLHRRADLLANLQVLDNRTELDALFAHVTSQTAQPEINATLSAAKLAEIDKSLTYGDDGKTDTPIHFKHNFIASRRLHAKLAEGWRAESDVGAALATSMSMDLPNDSVFKDVLTDWLTFRRVRAEGVTAATHLEGDMVRNAIARWDAERFPEPAKMPVQSEIDVSSLADGASPRVDERPKNPPQQELPPAAESARPRPQPDVPPIPTNVVAAVVEAQKHLDSVMTELAETQSQGRA